MHIHFIAIGGAVMHNLAIALQKKGFRVSGSDDELFDPSRTRLKKYGLLPEQWGWYPEKITEKTDAVILGMHAHEDNPELLQARKMKVRIYSFPEYLYEQTKKKKRIVIAGSHGKTTITSMVMHVLKKNNKGFDYMVGSQLEGFETMVNLEKGNEIAIFEGDEYLSSPLDKRPKFLHYKPHLALISGIAWDHMNVFPDFQDYLKQFEKFVQTIRKNGILIYNENDDNTLKIANTAAQGIHRIGYTQLDYQVENGKVHLKTMQKAYPVNIFGRHNMENLAAAMNVCKHLGIAQDIFMESMSDFKGAARRQELIASSDTVRIYHDFAHAPSKVKATVDAFKEFFPDTPLLACLELHTFSSLNKKFMPQYAGTLKKARQAVVFYNPEVVEHKRLEALSNTFIRECFDDPGLKVVNNPEELQEIILERAHKGGIILLMSSGNFSGLDLEEMVKEVVGKN